MTDAQPPQAVELVARKLASTASTYDDYAPTWLAYKGEAEELLGELRGTSEPAWSPPFRHHIEVRALSLWLDGKHDEAREALSPFTAIGAAEFAGRLNSFRAEVVRVGAARLAQYTSDGLE